LTLTITQTNPDVFFAYCQETLDKGYTLKKMRTYWQFVSWRYVRFYTAQFELQRAIRFDFGPVTDRPLPVVHGG
jgi:hypothetical protein